MTDREVLQALLAELSQSEVRQGEMASIKPEDLVAFRHGNLEAAKTRAVRQALVTDRRLADMMLELSHFEGNRTIFSEPQVGPGEVDLEWRQLAAKLQHPPPRNARLHRIIQNRPILSMAAALVVGVGLTWLVLWWSSSVDSLGSSSRTAILTLKSTTTSDLRFRSKRRAAEPIELSPDTAILLVRVRSSRVLRNAAYRYEILSNGKVVRQGRAWSEDDPYITFLVRRRGLTNGKPYQVSIFDDEDGAEVARTEFEMLAKGEPARG